VDTNRFTCIVIVENCREITLARASQALAPLATSGNHLNFAGSSSRLLILQFFFYFFLVSSSYCIYYVCFLI
jgi:hypothetical protein